MGNYLESSSQAVLAGAVLAGRLGACHGSALAVFFFSSSVSISISTSINSYCYYHYYYYPSFIIVL